MAKAAAEARGDGMGPHYRHLLDAERAQQERYGHIGNSRRPRYLLDALAAGETVEVPCWRVPALCSPRSGNKTVTVTFDM
ncbi:hypothetical protein BH10ACT9_BH10ACT9_58200 [soil metagenome]